MGMIICNLNLCMPSSSIHFSSFGPDNFLRPNSTDQLRSCKYKPVNLTWTTTSKVSARLFPYMFQGTASMMIYNCIYRLARLFRFSGIRSSTITQMDYINSINYKLNASSFHRDTRQKYFQHTHSVLLFLLIHHQRTSPLIPLKVYTRFSITSLDWCHFCTTHH